MQKHFFIVYDFKQDKRRARFVKILEKYGVRVQYSIFEFFLTKAREIELLDKLTKDEFLQHKKDEAIMIIPISKDIANKIIRFGDTVDIVCKNGIFSI